MVMDCGAMNVLIYCVPRARRPVRHVRRRVSGARMHAAYFRPGGVYRDLPDTMPQAQGQQDQAMPACHRTRSTRTARALCWTSSMTSLHPLPEERRRLRNAADRQPHLEAAHGRHWRRIARAGAEPGLLRSRCCAAQASPGTCARSSPMTSTRKLDFRHPNRHQWRHLRPLRRACGRDAPVQPNHPAVRRPGCASQLRALSLPTTTRWRRLRAWT